MALGALAGSTKSGLADLDVGDPISGNPPTPLGTSSIGEFGERYKYVQFSGATNVNVGDVVCYTAADTNKHLVDGANTNRGAGVAMVAVPTATFAQFAWIQVAGVATISTAPPGAVGGNLCTVGATAPGLAVSAAVTSEVVANLLNAAAHTIDCFFPG